LRIRVEVEVEVRDGDTGALAGQIRKALEKLLEDEVWEVKELMTRSVR